jgi:hypothetical protein
MRNKQVGTDKIFFSGILPGKMMNVHASGRSVACWRAGALSTKYSLGNILNKWFSSRMRVYKVEIGVSTAPHLSEGTKIMVQTKRWFVFMPFGNMNSLPEV